MTTEHGFTPDLLPATFDARSGPSGENPTGSVRVQPRAFPGGGTGDMPDGDGNRATIGFADSAERRDDPQPVARLALREVDAGPPPAAGSA